MSLKITPQPWLSEKPAHPSLKRNRVAFDTTGIAVLIMSGNYFPELLLDMHMVRAYCDTYGALPTGVSAYVLDVKAAAGVFHYIYASWQEEEHQQEYWPFVTWLIISMIRYHTTRPA